MVDIEQRLKELKIEIPETPKPAAAYIPAVTTLEKLIFLSGQDCRKEGVLLYKGKVGRDLSIEQGYEAARQAMLNLLSALKSEVKNLNKIKRIVKLLGFVNSAEGFNKQPLVINGASELLIEIFGENGKHSRSAISANELPFDTPVEIEMIVELK